MTKIFIRGRITLLLNLEFIYSILYMHTHMLLHVCICYIYTVVKKVQYCM